MPVDGRDCVSIPKVDCLDAGVGMPIGDSGCAGVVVDASCVGAGVDAGDGVSMPGVLSASVAKPVMNGVPILLGHASATAFEARLGAAFFLRS